MKKIITIFILFTAFIACCFAAVSCKSSRAVGGHKHELVTVKAKAVTCTEFSIILAKGNVMYLRNVVIE